MVQDVEAIARQILILKKGLLIEQKTPSELISALQGGVRELVVSPERLAELEAAYPVSAVSPEPDGRLRVRMVTEEALGKPAQPTLEDVYLYHFGGEHDPL